MEADCRSAKGQRSSWKSIPNWRRCGVLRSASGGLEHRSRFSCPSRPSAGAGQCRRSHQNRHICHPWHVEQQNFPR
ncbi:hypothetical protein BKA80DRAFT_274897 [Phyllosticta citrichinensis]